MFEITPQLLEMALERLGIAAGQLKNLDTECKKALIGFMIQAVKSGDANGYIKKRLAWLASYEEPPPEPVRASSRRVDDPPPPSTRSNRLLPKPRR